MNNNNSFSWSQLEPWCLLRRVLHDLWMVVLSAVICVLCAEIFFITQNKNTYCTRLTFVVLSRSSTSASQDATAANTVAANFSEFLETSFARRTLTEAAGLTSFSGSIQTSNTADTNLFTLTVQADSARESFLVSRAVMNTYKELIHYVYNGAAVSLLNSPVSYTVPGFSGSKMRVRLMAGLAGALAMAAFLCWYAVQQDTVQTVKSARDKLDAKLLLSIHHEKPARGKKKRSLLITEPTVSFAFTETIHKLRAQLEQKKEKDKRNVFLVTSVMENEGKSVVAENLAISLAQKRYTVLIIDCDYRKHSRFCDRPGNTDVQQVKFGDAKLCFVRDKSSGFYALYSPGMLKHPLEFLGSDSFATVLTQFRSTFDYIIIDSPPLELFSDAEVLTRTGAVSLLVVRQDMVPAPVINDAIDTLKHSSGGILGIVFNDVHCLLPSLLPAGADSGYYGYGRYGSYGKYGRYGKYAAASTEGGKQQ